MLNFRKLVALDIRFLGPKVILAEFSVGCVGLAALGIYSLLGGHRGTHSPEQAVLGCYLLSVGINYVPLLLYGIGIVRHRSAEAELADELGSRDQAFRKYRRQSLLLLVPLLVVFWAISHHREARTS